MRLNGNYGAMQQIVMLLAGFAKMASDAIAHPEHAAT